MQAFERLNSYDSMKSYLGDLQKTLYLGSQWSWTGPVCPTGLSSLDLLNITYNLWGPWQRSTLGMECTDPDQETAAYLGFSDPRNTTWIDTGQCSAGCAAEIPWLRDKLRHFTVTEEPAGSSHEVPGNMSPAWPHHDLKLQQEVLLKISFRKSCFPVGKLYSSSKI